MTMTQILDSKHQFSPQEPGLPGGRADSTRSGQAKYKMSLDLFLVSKSKEAFKS